MAAARERGEIDVDPWDPARVNPNSYNLRLGPDLVAYGLSAEGSGFRGAAPEMDLRAPPPPGRALQIPESGLVLLPGVLYLGHTVERTRAGYPWVPLLEGRSSVGRRGLSVHVSAGFGDVGFDGQWTLELTAVLPVRVYAGCEVAQVYFVRVEGEADLYSGRYQGQAGPAPARDWEAG
jgi:dCTP deaminase